MRLDGIMITQKAQVLNCIVLHIFSLIFGYFTEALFSGNVNLSDSSSSSSAMIRSAFFFSACRRPTLWASLPI